MTLATFRDTGKIPHSKNKLIRFAEGILIVLPNTLNTTVIILLGIIAFLLFKFLIISWISSGSVGVRKRFDWSGSLFSRFLFYFVLFLACSMGLAWITAVYPASVGDKQFLFR